MNLKEYTKWHEELHHSTESYTAKLTCANCYREKHVQIKRGVAINTFLSFRLIECEKCGCQEFSKSLFQ